MHIVTKQKGKSNNKVFWLENVFKQQRKTEGFQETKFSQCGSTSKKVLTLMPRGQAFAKERPQNPI